VEYRSASDFSAMSLAAIFSDLFSVSRGDLFRCYLRHKFV
jgi:hypothetical protein